MNAIHVFSQQKAALIGNASMYRHNKLFIMYYLTLWHTSMYLYLADMHLNKQNVSLKMTSGAVGIHNHILPLHTCTKALRRKY